MLYSFQKLYLKTGDKKYLAYGKIKGYQIYDFSLEMINNRKILFPLYDEYKDERYLKVMQTLRTQLEWQPRTKSDGLWHKPGMAC